MVYTNKLQDARILIIGGSSGIGFGAAEAILANGGVSKLFISSSQEKRVKDAVSRLKSAYPSSTTDIQGFPCDLGDETTIEENITNLLSQTGELDHIIHTAGDGLAMRNITEIDVAFIKKAGLVRFYAPLLIGKLAQKYLPKSNKSSITLTTGAVADKPNSGWTVVASYAAGLFGMTRNLALDLKPIRVNLISPGAVDTELWNMMDETSREKMKDAIAKSSATGQVGQVEDVAEAYLYCMKDKNLTGSVINTNGGALIV